MSKKQAFPLSGKGGDTSGMILREYASIHILAGLYANPQANTEDAPLLAKKAVIAADELFKCLKEIK